MKKYRDKVVRTDEENPEWTDCETKQEAIANAIALGHKPTVKIVAAYEYDSLGNVFSQKFETEIASRIHFHCKHYDLNQAGTCKDCGVKHQLK